MNAIGHVAKGRCGVIGERLTVLLERTRAGDRAARDALFAAAYEELRRLARSRLRGGDCDHVTLATDLGPGAAPAEAGIVEVHEALLELEQADPRAARMVEMRYFGGYTDKEIAEAMDVTERTVQRDWEKARMLLRAMLDPA